MRARTHGALRVLAVTGAGAAVVLGAGAWSGSVVVPGGTDQEHRPAQTTLVASASLTCPGAELGGAEGAPDLALPGTVLVAAPPPELVEAVTGISPGDDGSVDVHPLAGSSSASGDDADDADEGGGPEAGQTAYEEPLPLAVTARGGRAPGLVAVQLWSADAEKVRGLGSVACGEAVADAWLVAGGGAPGRQERLLLTNPGENSVTVDVTLHGQDGVVPGATGQGVVVPPGERVTVLLDALSATEESPVVHVTTEGGVVHAVLNDRWLDGTRAAGADDASVTAAPAEHQVIPAVGGDEVRVRIAVPGDREAVVQVRLLTAEGSTALPDVGVTRVPAGSVRDIVLDDLPDGTLGIEVEADRPVVAGAQVVSERQGGTVSDYAWAPATEPVEDLAGTVLGDGEHRLVVVSAGGPSTVDVVTVDADGSVQTRSVEVAADSSAGLDVSDAAAVWLRPRGGTGDVHAGVLTTSGDLVTVRPLVEPRLTQTDRRVTPRVAP